MVGNMMRGICGNLTGNPSGNWSANTRGGTKITECDGGCQCDV
jgi:hypothetical protein